MKKTIGILDCTLRDGARLIDGKFTDNEIGAIAERLADSNINYIEMGFLRDKRTVHYDGDSIFFTDPSQIEAFIPSKRGNSTYLAFVDYGMFDFDTLPECNGRSIDGIRVGFTKANYKSNWPDIVRCLNIVKSKGYLLLVQGVNTLSYERDELISLLNDINGLKPYGFGIVDTYGAMCLRDIEELYGLVNRTLDKEIAIDIHTHNNCQMAFALVQRVIDLSDGSRDLIIDATLEGIGKCAGNLNLELIAEYLNSKKQYNYDFDLILDTIEELLYRVKKEHNWGYSVPALMGGMYMSHPNNIIYLTKKFRLTFKDIKNIVSMISEEKRQRYDYDNIDRLYREYSATLVDDSSLLKSMSARLCGQNVLVVAPGSSLHTHSGLINEYVQKNNVFVISVNFQYSTCVDYVFFGNKMRYDHYRKKLDCQNVIVSSNINATDDRDKIVNYNSLIDRRYKYYDNSTMMLLNLLRILKVGKIVIAGLDGYTRSLDNNYYDRSFGNERHVSEFRTFNQEIGRMLDNFIKETSDSITVSFITPTRYEDYIEDVVYEYD